MKTARVLASVACVLLAVATSAHADRAWVLWGHRVGPSGESWFVIDAYEAKSACDPVQAKEQAREEKARQEAEAKVAFLPLKTSYKCLPDTIDPRGPKGK